MATLSARCLLAAAILALALAVATDAIKCPAGQRPVETGKKKVCSADACKPPAPKKLGSLIFVIDTTGSMGGEIKAVQSKITAIIAANTVFQNYVIAAYNDPSARGHATKVMKTTSADSAKRFVNSLRPSGGGDCPEMAMDGAIKAASQASSDSVLFLFTDASAKDAARRSEAIKSLRAKNIRFYTVATGNLCGAGGDAAYKEVAAATKGTVARLGRSDAAKVLDFIMKGVKGEVSFSLFPKSSSGLSKVLSGDCGCRVVATFKCQPVRGPKPGPGMCPAGKRRVTLKRKICSSSACKPSASKKLGSLIFVIDTTGSMGGEIKAVREKISAIIKANKVFQNYVIAAYNDPSARGHATKVRKTTSAKAAQRFVNSLRASGGGDCPEMAMDGVIKAASQASSDSVLFLFTDASAKDAARRSEAIKSLKARNIRFYTVATGNLCGRRGGAAYQQLAAATGGTVAKLGRSDAAKVLQFIQKGVSGEIRFSVFPSSASGLAQALSGRCCRVVTSYKCV